MNIVTIRITAKMEDPVINETSIGNKLTANIITTRSTIINTLLIILTITLDPLSHMSILSHQIHILIKIFLKIYK